MAVHVYGKGFAAGDFDFGGHFPIARHVDGITRIASLHRFLSGGVEGAHAVCFSVGNNVAAVIGERMRGEQGTHGYDQREKAENLGY